MEFCYALILYLLYTWRVGADTEGPHNKISLLDPIWPGAALIFPHFFVKQSYHIRCVYNCPFILAHHNKSLGVLGLELFILFHVKPLNSTYWLLDTMDTFQQTEKNLSPEDDLELFTQWYIKWDIYHIVGLVLWISCLANCKSASFIHLERMNVTDTSNPALPLLTQASVSYRTLHFGRFPFVAKDKGEQLVWMSHLFELQRAQS